MLLSVLVTLWYMIKYAFSSFMKKNVDRNRVLEGRIKLNQKSDLKRLILKLSRMSGTLSGLKVRAYLHPLRMDTASLEDKEASVYPVKRG